MKMNDSQRITAPQEKVWEALMDPEILSQCIPGCQELTMLSGTEMSGKIAVKVGPVKASFSGKVTFADVEPPSGCRINGEGSGGIAGFAKGGAGVRLERESDEVTIIHYTVDTQIGGKLAQLGSRMIDSTAKRLAGEFFDAFAKAVGQPQETAAST